MTAIRYEFARLRTDFYLSGVQDRYKRNKRVSPPRYVVWDCTRRCNLSCVHCGASDEVYAQELTTGQIKGVIDDLAECGTQMLAVTGGEPLLRKDLFEVLSYASERGLETGIATNGFLVGAEVAEKIREAGVSSVQVSLDGPERVHNQIRQNNQSFARAMEAIALLQRCQIPLLSVATTVTAGNISELGALKAVLLAAGVRLWRLAAVMPIGRARETGGALNGEQLVTMFAFVQEHRSRDLTLYVGENLTFLAEWEKKIRKEPAICPIGFTACCIGVDGNVRGCPEQRDVDENREGSLLDKPLSQIWQEGFGRYRSREILTLDKACAECASKYRCFGGCWVMREGDHHCIYQSLADSSY